MTLHLRSFVVLSAALHIGVFVLAAVRGEEQRDEPAPVVDRWAGRGVEFGALPIDVVTLPEAPSPPNVAGPAPNATLAPMSGDAPSSSDATPPRAPSASEPAKKSVSSEEAATRAEIPTVERPRAASRPRTGAAATEKASAASSASSTPRSDTAAAPGASAGTAAQEYGASGLPPGVRHLPNAFTRALAIANRADRRWRDLPLGRAGEAHLRLTVSESGELGELEFPDERERDALAPVVRHLLDNTRLLLQAGRFSLDPKKLTAGVARLRVMVELTEREGANPEGDPGELFGVAWEAPRRDKPGKSGFILNSGRQVTAWVWVE